MSKQNILRRQIEFNYRNAIAEYRIKRCVGIQCNAWLGLAWLRVLFVSDR